MLTDKEILENRRAVIDYLKKPSRKKARGALDRGNGKRCCLGHMCVALGLQVKVDSGRRYYDERWDMAPGSIIQKLGLHDSGGGSLRGKLDGLDEVSSLDELNDRKRISPQKIGEYLETVIMGGDHTPWRRIEE